MEPLPLEALPLPTVVIDGERIVQANGAFAALLGLAGVEAVVGRPYLDFVAPEDRWRIADRQRRRLAGEAVPPAYEASLVGAHGTVPVGVRVSLHRQRWVVQLLDLRGEASRRELLSSLARLGAAVQRELSADAIHRKVRFGLLALGIQSAWLDPAEGGLRVRWVEMGSSDAQSRLEELIGEPLVGSMRPSSPIAERVASEGAAFSDDWAVDAARWFRASISDPLRATPSGTDRCIGVRVDLTGAPSALLFGNGGWLRPEDLPAFRLFGSQVAAALEAASTVAQLRARNDDLAVLNRLADASAGSPDFESFLARAEEIVRDATGCNAFGVLLVEEERGHARLVRASRLAPEIEQHARWVPLDDPAVAALLREERLQLRHPPEFGEHPFADAMRRAGVGTAVGVPLRFRSGTVGLLTVDFLGPPRDAASCRAELLQAVGSHFAAAIETHRLLDDLRRRVAELTLLNDVTVATGALDPTLLLENALRRVAATLRAEVGAAFLQKGGRLVPAATLDLDPALLVESPGEARASLAAAAAELRAPVRAPSAGETERQAWFRRVLGVEASLAVPLLAKERMVGSLALGRRRPEPFDDGEVRLLSAVGVQLGLAVENARLFADTRRRVSDLEAVNALALRVFTTRPGDAAVLLRVACREIAAALDAEAAMVLRLDDEGQRLVGVAGWGTPVDPEQLSLDLARVPLAADALRTQEPIWAPAIELAAGGGVTGRRAPPLSLLFVPLTSRDARRGLVAIADTPPRRFDEAEVALALALASEAAMGLENAELYDAERRRVEELSRLNEENARLYHDLRASYAELARAQEQLIQQERLAALGQLAAVVAHEVRNPLAVIFNSVGTLRRLLQPQDDARMLFDIVGEEADRLNRMVADLLDFARPTTPQLQPEPIERILDDAAAAALVGVSSVRLERDLPEDLPPVPMDARLMRQAVLNVMSNAVQAMDARGTLRVRARQEAGALRLEIADTGCGIPDEVRHLIFEPFFTTRPTGTGLGLAVVKRILDDHHASVEVDSAEGGGTRFVLRLPLAPPSAGAGTPGALWSEG